MIRNVSTIASIVTVAIAVATSSARANFDEFEWTQFESEEASAFESNDPDVSETPESEGPMTYFPASLFPEALSYEVDEDYAAERPLDIVAAIDPLQVP